MAEKAATKKRPTATGDAPPPKKSKGFTAKEKKVDQHSLLKVAIPPSIEEMTMVPYRGAVGLAPPITTERPDTVVILDKAEGAEKNICQLDTAKESSAFLGPVAGLVSHIP